MYIRRQEITRIGYLLIMYSFLTSKDLWPIYNPSQVYRTIKHIILEYETIRSILAILENCFVHKSYVVFLAFTTIFCYNRYTECPSRLVIIFIPLNI